MWVLRSAALSSALLIAVPGAAFAQTAATTPTPFGDAAQQVNDAALGRIAGREDVNQAALSNQAAGVANNSVGDNSRTGDARIADNAFQNLSGLALLNVNTGNNVAINASMNVNISISPAP